jgi:uncharacterized protein YbaA (DUF1428 family)
MTALECGESVGDDMNPAFGLPFPRPKTLKDGEVAVFSRIVYKSRHRRDRVNAAAGKDPRMAKLGEAGSMPFDAKRMVYGGFEVMVDR